MQIYTNRSNCIRAARKNLGPAAKQGVHFEVTREGPAEFTWRAIVGEPAEMSDAEALEQGMQNDPAKVLDQPDDFAPMADDDEDGDITAAAESEPVAPAEAPAAPAAPTVAEIDPTLAALGLTAEGMGAIMADASARAATFVKPARKRVTVMSPVEQAAERGEFAELNIGSQANYTYQRRADAMLKLAKAGDESTLLAYEIMGVNTYGKLLRRYKTALLLALAKRKSDKGATVKGA